MSFTFIEEDNIPSEVDLKLLNDTKKTSFTFIEDEELPTENIIQEQEIVKNKRL